MYHRGFLLPVNYSLHSLFELIWYSLEDVLERRKIYINCPCGKRWELSLEGSFADSELKPGVPGVFWGCTFRMSLWLLIWNRARHSGSQQRKESSVYWKATDWQGNLGSKMLALPRSIPPLTALSGRDGFISVSNTPFLQDPFKAACLTAMSDLNWKGKQKTAAEFHY